MDSVFNFFDKKKSAEDVRPLAKLSLFVKPPTEAENEAEKVTNHFLSRLNNNLGSQLNTPNLTYQMAMINQAFGQANDQNSQDLTGTLIQKEVKHLQDVGVPDSATRVEFVNDLINSNQRTEDNFVHPSATTSGPSAFHRPTSSSFVFNEDTVAVHQNDSAVIGQNNQSLRDASRHDIELNGSEDEYIDVVNFTPPPPTVENIEDEVEHGTKDDTISGVVDEKMANPLEIKWEPIINSEIFNTDSLVRPTPRKLKAKSNLTSSCPSPEESEKKHRKHREHKRDPSKPKKSHKSKMEKEPIKSENARDGRQFDLIGRDPYTLKLRLRVKKPHLS
uniref:Uncharacterized protein n=1 Tax=Panagrolaimus sp. JU765 TaxID=591449 RepID=A0AC34QK73_9BILA